VNLVVGKGDGAAVLGFGKYSPCRPCLKLYRLMAFSLSNTTVSPFGP
jgi:hypothetical protein